MDGWRVTDGHRLTDGLKDRKTDTQTYGWIACGGRGMKQMRKDNQLAADKYLTISLKFSFLLSFPNPSRSSPPLLHPLPLPCSLSFPPPFPLQPHFPLPSSPSSILFILSLSPSSSSSILSSSLFLLLLAPLSPSLLPLPLPSSLFPFPPPSSSSSSSRFRRCPLRDFAHFRRRSFDGESAFGVDNRNPRSSRAQNSRVLPRGLHPQAVQGKE